jgi:two-component sensor histidine kinase
MLRLYALVALAVTPALALLVYNYTVVRNQRELTAEVQSLRYARLMASDMGRMIEGVRSLLLAAGASHIIQERAEPQCSDYLQRLVDVIPSTTSISIYNLNGDEVCKIGGPSINVKDRLYFNEVVATRQFVIGEYITGRLSRQAALPLAAPLVDREGKFIGVIATTIKLEWMHNYLLSKLTDLPPQTAITIVDRNGTILVRLPVSVPTGATLRLWPQISGKEAGGTLRTNVGEAMDGVSRFIGYTGLRAAPAGIMVIVGIPQQVAMTGLRESAIRNVSLMLLVAALAMLAAYVVGRVFLLRPIADLVDGAEKLRRGDLSTRVKEDGQSELGRLGRTFNAMAADLEEALRHKDLLLREMSHRVMNSLQTISSLFVLQARTTSDQTSRSYLDQAVTRINSMALAYRRLHATEGIEVIEFSSLLRELSKELSDALLPKDLHCQVEADAVMLSPDQAVPLALIVNELVTNAIKHGSGPFTIKLGRSTEGCKLAVRNAGVLPAGFDPSNSRRFGMRMVISLVTKIEGRLDISSMSGEVEFAVTFPPKVPQPTTLGVVDGALDFA